MLSIEPHPLLDLGAFVTRFTKPLGDLATSDRVLALLRLGAASPLEPTEETRKAIRDCLRYGGYKPAGRGKPSSEYLVRAAKQGVLKPINPAVDTCNGVSLHSGLPVSVVDLDRAESPFRVGIADDDASYVFNPAGQEIRLKGLLCLHDGLGPCANAVKDAQRTKTDGGTRRTLSLVWGARALGDRTRRTVDWYRQLLGEIGAETEAVSPYDL